MKMTSSHVQDSFSSNTKEFMITSMSQREQTLGSQ